MLLALVVLLPAAGCDAFGQPQHNLILIVLDSTRVDAFGVYGSERGLTPAFDALARDGVRFEQAIVHSPWTLPSISSLLTSTYPTIHGALGKMLHMNRFGAIRDSLTTAAEALEEAGFTTHAIVNALFLHGELGLDRGFDGYDLDEASNYLIRRAEINVDLAIDHLSRHRTQRNFLLIHVFDPHLDYDPPLKWKREIVGPYRGPLLDRRQLDMYTAELVSYGPIPPDPERRYIEDLYLAEIAGVDAAFGRLFDKLREMGMYEPSTIVVTADHGEEFWDHDGFEHGHTLYDELIRVPLIIKPGRLGDAADLLPLNRVVTESVRQIDVMPSLFELVDVAVPESFEGESFAAVLREEAGSIEPRAIYAEEPLYDQHTRTEEGGESITVKSELISLRTDGYQLVLNLDDGVGELYDIRTDPGQQHDLAREEPARFGAMQGELLAFAEELLVRAQAMEAPREFDMQQAFWEDLVALGYIDTNPAPPPEDPMTKLDKVRALSR